MVGQFGRTETVTSVREGIAFGERSHSRGVILAWRPAPVMVPARKRHPAKTSKVARSIWLAPETDALGEKLMLGLLVGAAALGIGYGLTWLLDLVQNWAAFHSGIAQMVQ